MKKNMSGDPAAFANIPQSSSPYESDQSMHTIDAAIQYNDPHHRRPEDEFVIAVKTAFGIKASVSPAAATSALDHDNAAGTDRMLTIWVDDDLLHDVNAFTSACQPLLSAATAHPYLLWVEDPTQVYFGFILTQFEALAAIPHVRELSDRRVSALRLSAAVVGAFNSLEKEGDRTCVWIDGQPNRRN